MPALRPEFGPTLPEVARPALAAAPRWLRRLVVGGTAALVLLVVLVIALRAGGVGGVKITREKVEGPVPFTLAHRDGLLRETPDAGVLLALGTREGLPRETLTVREVRLPPYTGDVSVPLLAEASGLIRRMQESDPAFVYRGEGRARINDLPGWVVSFQTRREDRLVYGKRFLLMPRVDEDEGEAPALVGIDMTLESRQSPVVPNLDAVGANGLLKTPLRSVRFGTDGP